MGGSVPFPPALTGGGPPPQPATLPTAPWAPTPPQHALGPLATDAAVTAILGRDVPPVADVLAGDADSPVAWWDGQVLDNETKAPKTGRFWIPAAFRADLLPAKVRDVKSQMIAKGWRHPEHGGPATGEDAAANMIRWHSGLGNDAVAWVSTARVEIDHLPEAEQIQRYTDLATATGLGWTLWCHTGGKSVHAYMAFDRRLAPKDPIFKAIQELLIVICEGDHTILPPAGLMRLPGYDGPDRQQPIRHLDQTARHAPEAVLQALRGYAARLGVADVPTALAALATAKRLADKAKHVSDPQDKADLLALAARLRATRGSPAQADTDLAGAMLGRGPQGPQMGLQGPFVGTKGGKVYRVPATALEPYKGLPAGTRTEAPCCASAHSSRAGIVQGPGRLYCFRCGHVVVADDDKKALPTDTELDELVKLADVRDALRDGIYAPTLARADAKDAALPTDAESLARVMHGAAKEARQVWLPRLLDHFGRSDLLAAQKAAHKARGGHCGVTLGMVHRPSADAAWLQRGCRSSSCPTCGPNRLALLAATLANVPMIDERGMVGKSFGKGAAYLYAVDAAHFERFAMYVNKLGAPKYGDSSVVGVVYRRISTLGPLIPVPGSGVSHLSTRRKWVAFRGHKTFTILTDSPIPQPKKAKWLKGGKIVPQAKVGETIFDLICQTYKMETDPIGSVEITGKVSTSRGIHTDPQSLWSMTRRAWTVHDPHVHAPDAVGAAAEGLGLAVGTVTTGTDPDDVADVAGVTDAQGRPTRAVKRVTAKVGVKVPVTATTTPQAVAALWAAVHRPPKARPKLPGPVAAAATESAALDAVVDAVLGG